MHSLYVDDAVYCLVWNKLPSFEFNRSSSKGNIVSILNRSMLSKASPTMLQEGVK